MNVQIVDYDKKRIAFEDYHETGGASMTYAGFECFKGIFQFAMDGVTDITGLPTSGKSEFALELLFHQSEEFGKRHLLYVPDMGSYNEIRRKLVVKYYKRSFRGYHNSISKSELTFCSAWVDQHFLIAQKIDPKKSLSPIDLWNFAVDYEDKSGVLDTCLIDSWKNLYHDFQGREDQYLDYVLSYRNELAEQKQKHFMTIAHPKNVEFDKDTKKRRIPDANDISGGASWFRSGKTIITVDWADKTSPTVDIYFSKVKPDTIGLAKPVIGMLEFDWQKSRYRETINGRICYAGDAKRENIGTQSEEFLKKFDKPNVIAPSKNLEIFNDDVAPF
jgi:hypothetical protein